MDKVRKKSLMANPEVVDLEERLAESLGTRVHIEPKDKGGKIMIDYFSEDELFALASLIKKAGLEKSHEGMFDKIKKDMDFSSFSQKLNNNEEKNEMKEVENILPLANSESTLPVLENIENHIGDLIIEEKDDKNNDKNNIKNKIKEVLGEKMEDNKIYEEKGDLNNFSKNETIDFINKDLNDYKLEDDRSKEEIKAFEERQDDLYDITNFSL